MMRPTLFASTLLVCAIPNTGCWLAPVSGDTPVLEADDVRVDPPGNGFRAAGERGDAYALAHDVARDVNRWVAEVAVGMSRVVRELNRYPARRTEGALRIYGPYDDDNGEDASWMAHISGDGETSSYALYIGRRGANEDEMDLLIAGDIAIDQSERSGGYTLEVDTLRKYNDVLHETDPDDAYGGKITVTFSRDRSTDYKQVDIDFDGFYVDDGEDDLNFDGERYRYHRDVDGAGTFHFATWSSFEHHGWSGPEKERMVVDMAWDRQQAGRARGMVVQVDGEGDLLHGDVVLYECFDGNGGLTWRQLNEPYASYEPGYNFGDPQSCVIDEQSLETSE